MSGAWLLDLPAYGGLGTLLLVAIAAGAFAQATTGMGFSLVAAPALILALGPQRGVSTVLLLAVLASIVPLSRDWRHSSPRQAARLLVPTLAFTPVVVWALRGLDTHWLSLAAGLGVLVGVVLLAIGLRSRWLTSLPGAVATGLSSAVLNVVGGVGGPPIGIYATNTDWSPERRRATLQTFFLVQNIVTVLLVGIVLPSLAQVAALVAGSAAGMVLAPRLSTSVARTCVLAVSLVGGVGLIVGAL